MGLTIVKKKYITLFKISIQETIAYRFNYLMTILSAFISLLTMLYIWQGIFNGSDRLNGFTWPQMKTYLFVTFVINTLVSWYSETRISRKIRDGNVAMDLIKPLDFQKTQLAFTLGASMVEGGIAVLVCLVLVLLTGSITLPTNSIVTVLFLLSLVAALFIKFSIVYMFGMLCFWTTSALGVAWMRAAITNLFSGAMIPIVFFPDWLLIISRLLPFQGIIYIPASIFIGTVTVSEALRLVGLQCFWVIFLWFAGKIIWSWAVKKVTIHGG